jgi:putative efflux protein, MATE family
MQGAKDLTQGSISKQLFNLAIPIMGTSFTQMAYSITDMAWIGRIGSEAVAAIGAVGILTWMTTSIALLNRVGAEVSVGQSIGAQDVEKARSFASHNLTISLILSILWGGLLFALAFPIISIYKLEPNITHEAAIYLQIVTAAFPFIFLSAAFTGIYNASGQTKIPFFISATGLVVNMILDPLFIWVFEWGITGAAWATWLSQGTVLFLFLYNIKVRNPLFNGFPILIKLNGSFTRRIFQLGLPVALLNALFAIINLFMARTASIAGGHIGLMTLTAGGQIEAIAWNTSQGFSSALGAFVAQNYAAQKRDRVNSAYHTTLVMTSVLGICCTLLFVFFGSEVFSLIVPNREAYEAGGIFLRIDGYSMWFMMLEITMQGLFYGTGRTLPPAIISITFNLLRIPLAIYLAGTFLGIEGVWWAISITSTLKGIVAFGWFRILKKRLLK